MSVNYVEYLYGDNNSYIDTGIVVQSGYQIEVTFMSTEKKMSMQKNDWSGIFGVGNPISYSYDTAPYGISVGLYGSGVAVKNNNVTKLDYLNIDQTCYNQKYTLGLTAGENVTNPANLFLFAVNFTRDAGKSNPYAWGYSCLRVYDFKIYNAQGTLIQHLKPCLDIEGIPCMYDEVSGEYFKNLGTGTFGYEGYHLYLFADNNENTAENLGNYRLYNMKIEGDSEGVESGVNYVDCLIGDGASYIDTGIVVRNGYTIDLTFASTIDRYNQEPICGSGDVVGYTYDRFGGYGIGLRSYFVAVREIRDEANTDKNELETTTVTFAIDEKVNFSHKFTNVNNNGSCLVMGQNYCDNSNTVLPLYKTSNTVKLYDFKIYDDNDTLLMHLKPCLDTEGIPCMYDEVSGEYFENLGTGTFGYKKELRDFQPVLDSNGVPCLMDKINKKYYYDKNGKGFKYNGYTRVGYIQSDNNSWIDTGIYANPQYKIELVFEDLTEQTYETFFSVDNVSELRFQREGKKIVINYNGQRNATYQFNTNTKYKLILNKNLVHLNDKIIYTFTEDTSTTNYPTTLKLWKINETYPCDYKLYSFKMWNENSELVFDGIPALDNEGTPCMYDLVTETFFYNQGTGEFSYGIEEEECPKVANAIDYIKKISRNNDDYFRTKNFNGLINENLIIKTKIALGSLRDNNGAYFQTVGQYNMNRLYLGYNKNNNQLQYTFFGANDSVTLTDYDVFNDEVWEIELSKNGLTVNGVFIKSLESDITGTSLVVPLYIFQTVTYLDKPNGNALPGQKIYELIFEQDGQIIANFQPCLDDNGNLCFCDIVDNTYYYPTLGTSYEYNQLLQTPIKYIETNGTQYIDTSVVPTDNTDIDMVARAVAKEYTQVEYLQGDGDNYLNIGDWTFDMNTRVEVQVTAGTGNVLSNTLTTGTFYIARIEQGSLRTVWSGNTVFQGGQWFGSGINKAIVSTSPTETVITHEGTDYTSTSDITSFSANLNLQVFGQNAYATGAIKVHYLQIYESEILVFDGIPVLDNGGTPCMYDKVNNQYFYNQGTGTFAHGNAVDKNYLMNDFYIESTYKYKETDTTVEPNLTASEGATLTLGSTYMSYLSEEELEQATKNGWIIE